MAELWLRSRIASAPAVPLPVHSDAEVRAWFAEVVVPRREAWLAERSDLLIALLVLEDGWVDQLYVDPGRTGAGVGTLLLDLAKDRRPHGLQLWTFAANVDARRFYERNGFLAVQTTDGANEEGMPDVRYQWTAGALSTGS